LSGSGISEGGSFSPGIPAAPRYRPGDESPILSPAPVAVCQDAGAPVIMPDHVHLLLTLGESESLAGIVASWKRFSAGKIPQQMRNHGTLWQKDYFDRIIRDWDHFVNVARYIRRNPTKAKLHEEADALLILEYMGDALGGGTDDAEGKIPADSEGKAGEGGDVTPGERMVGVLAILALDRPEVAVVGLGDDVDALVGGGELEFPRDGLRDFALEPDMLEFAGVFRFELEVGFDEFLEQVALLLLGQFRPGSLDVLP